MQCDVLHGMTLFGNVSRVTDISTSPVKMPQTEFLHNNQVLYLHNANTTASYHAICRADSELQKIQSENSVARDMARTIDTSYTSPVKMPQTEFLHNNQVLYLHNANTTASYHAICRADSELQKIQSENSVARDMARTIDTSYTSPVKMPQTEFLHNNQVLYLHNANTTASYHAICRVDSELQKFSRRILWRATWHGPSTLFRRAQRVTSLIF
ncbi:Argininosuccinate synthase [Trichinella pseudospiralis]